MRLGTRITLTTVTLVLITLGLYGLVTVRERRAELEEDLERNVALAGRTAQVALEEAIKAGRVEEVSALIARWQAADPNLRLTYIDLSQQQPGREPPGFAVAPLAHAAASDAGLPADGGAPSFVPPTPDPARAQRMQRVAIEGRAFGEHVAEGPGHPRYVFDVPIFGPGGEVRGAPAGIQAANEGGRLVGALELERDETDTTRALSAAVVDVVVAVAGLSVGLALLVWLSTRSGISNPVKRLVEAIDDVTHGDLGRVILRERDDEVGDLAERFNEMTASLREARTEIMKGVDAKLALEARLRHSEKLATIGQLAAGIAHEVGTPLNVIGGRARTMEKKAGDPAEVAKNAGIIAAQSQRITKIIQQLLDFARRPQSVRRRVDLQAVAKDTLDFLEHQIQASGIEAALGSFAAASPDAPASSLVSGDPDQLQQVCLNLCLNAIQAMPDGGRLELGARSLCRRRPGLDAAAPGGFVMLEVADTGVGIPEADRERIFEPFYSTKSPGSQGRPSGGTGLGLAVSVGIVKDHDGWIEIASRPGGGTLFRVFLPALDENDSQLGLPILDEES